MFNKPKCITHKIRQKDLEEIPYNSSINWTPLKFFMILLYFFTQKVKVDV